MLGHFEPEKVRQAAGVIFRTLNRGVLGRMQLLKLLYIADRETVRKSGYPITGDQPYAMEWGPVLSDTYNCIKGTCPGAAIWNESFLNLDNKRIQMVREPGTEALSPFEIDQLEEVARQYGHLTGPQLSAETHRFAEWLRNKPGVGSANAIPPRDLLDAVGLSSYADTILQEADEYAFVDQLLAQTAA